MKRILVSLGTVVFMGALIASGTGAFFSDSETSTGNTFSAGAIDLTVDSAAHYNGLICFDGVPATAGTEWIPESTVVWDSVDMRYELTGADVPTAIIAYNNLNPAANPKAGDACGGTWTLTDLGPNNTFFNFSDIKPGDSGENTVSLHVNDNDAYVCAAIHNVVDADNTQTEPESDDDPDGLTSGELAEALHFRIWSDDGDNIFEPGSGTTSEEIISEGPASNLADGVVYPLFTPLTGPLAGTSTTYLGVEWCFGTFTSGVCSGTSTDNAAQTDSFSGDVVFYVEQARNNDDFSCPDIDDISPDTLVTTVVTANTIAQNLGDVASNTTKWFFYNDETDVIDSTLGSFVAGPSIPANGTGSAQISVTGTQRRNLATYQFGGTLLNDINALSFVTLSQSAGDGSPNTGRAPYLFFDVDFSTSTITGYQNRLVYVPSTNAAITPDAWQTWNTTVGTWGWSGFANGPDKIAATLDDNSWPDGSLFPNRTWASIVAAFPNASVRVTTPQLGVRVGEPYANGFTGNIDAVSITVNGNTQEFDFDN